MFPGFPYLPVNGMGGLAPICGFLFSEWGCAACLKIPPFLVVSAGKDALVTWGSQMCVRSLDNNLERKGLKDGGRGKDKEGGGRKSGGGRGVEGKRRKGEGRF